MRAVLAITSFCLLESSLFFAPVAASRPRSGQPSDSATRRDTTIAGTLHRVLAESFRVDAVRTISPTTLRVVLEDQLVKEPAYRAVLVRGCEAVLKSRNDAKRGIEARALTTIEIVNRDERQGYVFRNLRGCADVVQADQEGRRLAIVPGTTVFVPRRTTKR
jgi:hypothetical protein